MIIAFFIWLGKTYIIPEFRKRKVLKTRICVPIYLALSIYVFEVKAQEQKFQIKRNDQIIGQMLLKHEKKGDDLFLTITSKIKIRFLFNIELETEDFAHFNNGRLITSTVRRILNGKAREEKTTRFIANRYQLISGSKISAINVPITFNMMLIYENEPLALSSIYSDNFQCFLDIKKVDHHQYRIDLPDGNYNKYLFENGTCKLITIKHLTHTIKIQRV